MSSPIGGLGGASLLRQFNPQTYIQFLVNCYLKLKIRGSVLRTIRPYIMKLSTDTGTRIRTFFNDRGVTFLTCVMRG
jgi:hypothetical protein